MANTQPTIVRLKGIGGSVHEFDLAHITGPHGRGNHNLPDAYRNQLMRGNLTPADDESAAALATVGLDRDTLHGELLAQNRKRLGRRRRTDDET